MDIVLTFLLIFGVLSLGKSADNQRAATSQQAPDETLNYTGQNAGFPPGDVRVCHAQDRTVIERDLSPRFPGEGADHVR